MKIVLSGATGLVGSRFYDLFKSKYEISPLSSSFGVDITDKKEVAGFLKSKNPDIVIHMAAKTNVDMCEEDKKEDLKLLGEQKIGVNLDEKFENLDTKKWKGKTTAFAINTVGTKNIADWTSENLRKIIYISTDFVFDGEKGGGYSEEDSPSPIDWYGATKLFGENVLSGEFLITRISHPFGYKNQVKKDIVWKIVDVLKNNEKINLVTDQIITPTFIDDIASGIDFLIKKEEVGLINLVGNNSLSPYEMGKAIAREFMVPEHKLETITRSKFYKNRAARPFKAVLQNDKLRGLGFEMTDFFEALKKIKQ